MKVLILICALTVSSVIALGGQNTCVDPPVKIAIATYPGSSTSNGYFGVWGDGATRDSDGSTLYLDGVAGVYAKFQVCNNTYDLILNLLNARGRTLWWNWGHDVGNCVVDDPTNCVLPPAWTATTPQKGQSFINADEVFSLRVGQEVTTWVSGSFNVGSISYGARWRNPNATYYNDDPATNLDIINESFPTALMRASRSDCSTYTLTAIPGTDLNGNALWPFPVGTLMIPAGRNSPAKNAGQYEMPFSMTVQLLQKSALDPDPQCQP